MLTEMQMAARTLFPAFTGDESHAILYVVIGILAIAILLLLAFKDKIFKKKQEGTEKEETNTADQKNDQDKEQEKE